MKRGKIRFGQFQKPGIVFFNGVTHLNWFSSLAVNRKMYKKITNNFKQKKTNVAYPKPQIGSEIGVLLFNYQVIDY